MNKTIFAGIIGLSTLLGGCNLVGVSPTNTQYPVLVATDAVQIQNDVQAGTSIYLLTIKDQTQRTRVAQRINQIAQQTEAFASNPNVNLVDISNYVTTLIQASDSRDSQNIALIVNAASSVLVSQLNINFNTSNDVRLTAARSFIAAAATGVEKATSAVLPSTQPSAQ